MSLYLTEIFLPYRLHFNFFIPLPNFLRRLSLSHSHPESTHPCLRNACHLAACNVLGGRWADLEPYFAERTRQFLEEALMHADRDHITQFLWASVLLASYLLRARRVRESYAVISPASNLSMACGLSSSHNTESEPEYRPDQFLLPPPASETEALERIWLASSIFMTDHSLSLLMGCSGTLVCDPRWRPDMDEGEIGYSWFKIPRVDNERLSKIWQSDIHRNISITLLFIEVTGFVLSAHKSQSSGDVASIALLNSFINFHNTTIPPLSDAANNSNSNILLSHAMLYGTSAIFYSLFARKDPKARGEMVRCAQKLVEVCKQLQGHKRLHIMQTSLVPMFHMLNAIRIFAHELRRHDAEENPTISTEYCYSIQVVLDFLGGMTALYPAWKDSPELVKGTLTSAMESLKI
ncbi:hypothetical protein DL93DRAFT_2169450 [Clavulina sp. PMI_390]|nr:hypothetical protein DL93DRAFT_2169450 [Clavulina sp. PMI_390]